MNMLPKDIMAAINNRVGDPNQLMEQLARNNPNVRKALEVTKGRTTQERWQYAMQMAKQRSTSIEDVLRGIATRR